MLAFLRSALTGEIFALNVPKPISVVESEDGEAYWVRGRRVLIELWYKRGGCGQTFRYTHEHKCHGNLGCLMVFLFFLHGCCQWMQTSDHSCKLRAGAHNFSPQLLPAEDVSGAEEGDAGESQVLMQHEHSYWDEVWVTKVVDEAADVAIIPGINAIHLSILNRKQEAQWSNDLSVFPAWCLFIFFAYTFWEGSPCCPGQTGRNRPL